MTVTELDTLHDVLLLNSQHLHTLDIDLVHDESSEGLWPDENPALTYGQRRQKPFGDNFIATIVLGLEPGEQFILFPRIQELRLSEVSFNLAAMEIACALNITNLYSLKLHNCKGYLELLDSVIKAPQPIRLTSFELLTRHYESEIFRISNFLEAFTGLEELYLSLPYDMELREGLWPSIQHHKSSLKRLVCDNLSHDGSVNLDHNIKDGSTQGSAYEAVIDLPLVECIGVNDSGSSLVSYIAGPGSLSTVLQLFNSS